MTDNTFRYGRRQPMTIDGFRPQSSQAQAIAVPAETAYRPQRRQYFKPAPATRAPARNIWQKLQMPLLLLAGSTGGFLAGDLVFGLVLLTGYAILAFVTRIPSRTTFTLAFLLLGAISVMLLLKPDMQLIGNFATYAFVLLLIGVVTLGRESRLPKRTRRKQRKR